MMVTRAAHVGCASCKGRGDRKRPGDKEVGGDYRVRWAGCRRGGWEEGGVLGEFGLEGVGGVGR